MASGWSASRASRSSPRRSRRASPAIGRAFADRAYLPDGRLKPRDQPGAVLAPDAAVEQAIRLARSGDYDTICVHGDSPGSERVAAAIRAGLEAAGITTGRLRR